MLHAALVKGIDLNLWSERLDARSQLPRLVRRLVSATSKGLKHLGFPADEGIQNPGWDGIVETAEGNSHVPAHVSVWEMGVNRNVVRKADDDYRKRSENPLGVIPGETSFVFVTPRRWDGKEKWAEARQAEGVWRDVRAYDSEDIVLWLEQAPAVHIWLSQMLGRLPEGAISLDTFWAEWSQETSPALSPELIIGGRDEHRNKVLAWLAGEPARMLIQGDSEQESLAFLAATVQSLPFEERDAVLAQSVVVDNIPAWRALAMSPSPLFLIPRFGIPEGIGLALHRGHHVCLPQRRATRSEGIALPRLDRAAAEEALIRMGLKQDKACSMATLARRSLTALRRKLSAVSTPRWGEPGAAAGLLAPLLAGAWQNGADGDQTALARLADKSYADVQRDVVRWANETDPPVRQVGGIWMIVAREDSWRLLARYLTRDDLSRFEETALAVLGERNPALDLPRDKRWAANIYGKSMTYSGHLRSGITETLALMAALSQDVVFADAMTGADVARRSVERLFQMANRQPDLWISFSHHLPLLAEAAPNAFLDAVDAGTRGENPIVSLLFQDHDSADIFCSSPHTGLLWALETLAWNPECFSRAALCLAALVRIDPGGKMVNRPWRSLRDVLLSWRPSTASPPLKRLAVLDDIRKREPGVARSLLISLLPRNHAGISLPHKPDWRDWLPETALEISPQEYQNFTTAVLERLLSDAGSDAARWCGLIKDCGFLLPAQREKLLQKLEGLDVMLFSSEDRASLRDALRAISAHHRGFPDAWWAMPAEHVDRLDRIYQVMEPDDLFSLHRWLFRRHVTIPGLRGSEWEERAAAIEALRANALRDIIDASGFDSLFSFAQQAEDAVLVGETLARAEMLHDGLDAFLTQHLAHKDPTQARVAMGVVSGGAWKYGTPWAAARRTAAREAAWPAEKWSDFLLAVPFRMTPLDEIEQIPEPAQRAFWTGLTSIALPEDTEGAERVLSRLIHYGNPKAALDAMERARSQKPDLVPPARIADLLEACVKTVSSLETDGSTFACLTAELLTSLETVDLPEERLAQLEWAYLFVHQHYRRPKILNAALANDPKMFVEVLQYIYLEQAGDAEDEGDQEMSEDEAAEAQRRAQIAVLAEELLQGWHELPGKQKDGSVDAEALKTWVVQARALASECHRIGAADRHIGQILAFSPPDTDGIWPHPAVRSLIEELSNVDIENNCLVQVRNNRGCTSRGLTDGGVQERTLAARYAAYAQAVDSQWPRTAALLRELAERYAQDAAHQDIYADLTQDFWR